MRDFINGKWVGMPKDEKVTKAYARKVLAAWDRAVRDWNTTRLVPRAQDMRILASAGMCPPWQVAGGA